MKSVPPCGERTFLWKVIFIKQYIFRHYSYREWQDNYMAKGFKAYSFSDKRSSVSASGDAEAFLNHAYRTLFVYPDLSEQSVVAIKLVDKSGDGAILRIDRDYFEIVKIANGERKTVYAWQSSKSLCGYRIYELWCNMLTVCNVESL